MISEEILLEIDATLDRLINNAEAIDGIHLNDLSQTELDAFLKTQDSLFQHLLHMDQHLQTKINDLKKPSHRGAKYQIQEKLLKFESLKKNYQPEIKQSLSRKSELLSKRRAKRLVELTKNQ